MSSKQYLDSLQSFEEDFEPGLLSELRMEAPDMLHSSVMSGIRKEKKKRLYLNYKLYMPVAAAILVAAIFINGGKNFVNQMYADSTVKHTTQPPQAENIQNPTVTPKTTPNTIGKTLDTGKSNTVAIEQPANTVVGVKPSSESTVKSNTQTKGNNTSSVTQKAPATKQDTTSQNSGDKTNVNTDIISKDLVANSGAGQDSQSSEKDSKINMEVVAESKSPVVNFLHSYGTVTEDGQNKVYKLSISYFEQLSNAIENSNAENKVLNGTVSGNELIIKLVVNE